MPQAVHGTGVAGVPSMRAVRRHNPLKAMRAAAVLAAVGLGVGVSACDREQRSFRVPPSAAETPAAAPALDPIRPGGGPTTGPTTRPATLARLTNEPFR